MTLTVRRRPVEFGTMDGSGAPEITMGGTTVQLLKFEDAIRLIGGRATGSDARPLGVVSVDLDHLHHFGKGGRWGGALDGGSSLEWLSLLHGAPLVAQAKRLTGQHWPRLAASDLIGPLLDVAAASGARVGFLGGSAPTQERLKVQLSHQRPELVVAGWWAPERSVLSNPRAASALADEVAAAGVDMLVVGLAKPRQELWMAEYGDLTGAKVLLGFGAVVDFLAGRVQRFPGWVSAPGLERPWRFAIEPKRLARGFLVVGLPAYLKLRTASHADVVAPSGPEADLALPQAGTADGTFVTDGGPADVAVLAVTYNNAADIAPLIENLRSEALDLRLRVIVVDNNSADGTLAELHKQPDVIAFAAGGNLGHAGGINVAARRKGDAGAVLVINPDLVVERGAISALFARMVRSDAGIVVPALLDYDGTTYPSLRREPTVSRALGDAAFGSRFPARPGWLSEIDYDEESYQHPHIIEWATGASLMIRADIAAAVGEWDERFFLYSEETDYFRRARDVGARVWFEPAARMRHRRGGSGTAPELTALMAVNKVKYAQLRHSRPYAALFRLAVASAEVARSYQPAHRSVALTVLNTSLWSRLPHATRASAGRQEGLQPIEDFPSGSVVIPAHNEAAVIARTLAALAPATATGRVEVVVACNGCTDGTEEIARRFDGVRVLAVDAASKVTALNAADKVATKWPRLYLDADIELPVEALRQVFDSLGEGELLAARPAFHYDTSGASPLVRSYYRARNRLPMASGALWGAGAYALSQAGRSRFDEFPALTADDYFVDGVFDFREKAVLMTEPVTVRTPRTPAALLTTLRRVYRGNAEQDDGGGTAKATLGELLRSIRGPSSAIDAVVYAGFSLAGRRNRTATSAVWERDESSR